MGNCWRIRRRNSFLLSEERSPVAIGQNQPLQRAPESWKTDHPITERQLKTKRNTFWETAPAYEGRCEIWDALKAACEAAEEGDYTLAQAIVDGANISLPTGRLVEAYDELGNRYVIPKYCISKPLNIITHTNPGASDTNASRNMPPNASRNMPPTPVPVPGPPPPTLQPSDQDQEDTDSSTHLLQGYTSLPVPPSGHQRRGRVSSDGSRIRKRTKKAHSEVDGRAHVQVIPTGDPVVIKIRVSTIPSDIKMTIQASDNVRDVKRRLEVEHGVPAQHVTMLYAGRVLRDGVYLKTLDIPKGFIIQAIVT